MYEHDVMLQLSMKKALLISEPSYLTTKLLHV